MQQNTKKRKLNWSLSMSTWTNVHLGTFLQTIQTDLLMGTAFTAFKEVKGYVLSFSS